MADSEARTLSIEVRGVIIALVAAVVSLGLAFGTAALMSARTPRRGGTVQGAPPSQIVLATPGQRLFLANCSPCHGKDARGLIGPDLHGLKLSDEQISATITNGRKGGMPAFGKRLTPSEIRALDAYVRTLKE